MTTEKLGISALLIVVLISLLVRVFFLSIVPIIITGDGVLWINQAKDMMRGNFDDISFLADKKVKASHFTLGYPLFIALFSIFIRDMGIAAITVSMVFGILVLFPLYYLAREIFNEKAALVSIILIALNPFAVIYSTSTLPQSLFTCVFVLGIFLGLLAIKRRKRHLYLLTGLTWGFAYLTRFESIIYFLMLPILMIAGNRFYKKGLSNVCISVSLIILGFLVIAAPYTIFNYKQTGKLFSPYLTRRLRFLYSKGESIRKPFTLIVPANLPLAFDRGLELSCVDETPSFRSGTLKRRWISEQRAEAGLSGFGFGLISFNRDILRSTGKHYAFGSINRATTNICGCFISEPVRNGFMRLFCNFKKVFSRYKRNFKPMLKMLNFNTLTPCCAWLLLFGIFRKRWSIDYTFGNLYLISFIFVTLVVFPLVVVSRRYYTHIVPLFLIIVARGIFFLSDCLSVVFLKFIEYCKVFKKDVFQQSWRDRLAAVLSCFIVCVLLFTFCLRLKKEGRTKKVYYAKNIVLKDVGLWIKENFPEKPVIISASTSFAYYAEGSWAVMPTGVGCQGLIRYAKNFGANLLIVDNYYVPKKMPLLAFLLDKAELPPELKLIYEWNKNERFRTLVYKISGT